MMISTKGRYALRVMIDLSSSPNEYIPLKKITQRQNISMKYLESIIAILVKEKFLLGLRGKGGGYKLAKKPSEYTVGSILKLTEGSLAPVSCLDPKSNQCQRSDQCPTLPIWMKLDHIIQDFLDGITLEDLITEPLEQKTKSFI